MTDPAAAGRSRGCTSRRFPTIIAACIAAVTHKQERNTRGMLRRFLRAHEGGRPRRRGLHCGNIAERRRADCFSRLDISRKFTVTCARRAASASPTKCRWALGAWARTSGDSKRRAWFRTSWFSASQSAMRFRSRRWSPRRKSPIRSTMAWNSSARLAAIRWRARRVWRFWMFSKKKHLQEHALRVGTSSRWQV